MITLFKDPKTWLIVILAVLAYYGFMCNDNNEKEAILEQDKERLLEELKTLKKSIISEDSISQQKRIDTVYIQTRKIIRDENVKENIRIDGLPADTATVFVPRHDSVWTEIHLLTRRR